MARAVLSSVRPRESVEGRCFVKLVFPGVCIPRRRFPNLEGDETGCDWSSAARLLRGAEKILRRFAGRYAYSGDPNRIGKVSRPSGITFWCGAGSGTPSATSTPTPGRWSRRKMAYGTEDWPGEPRS